ncbi:hypothetical protein VT84_35970 [Gemmata sp. SH-PL17]|uniref:hypothetical protein n=1 Tax=Gemmata sp. SH-PL17 TaxID=1630693 RepID=UPI00078C9345|nr:hypothetical protein [Gemmata sp. SH-PL17]AMV29847.1 hypothetical protein VT84_35970 [Gemmata sp. SH-PL17]
MRRGYSTITPAAVHAVTRRTLERALGWTDYKGSVTDPQLLDLVLRVARTTRPCSRWSPGTSGSHTRPHDRPFVPTGAPGTNARPGWSMYEPAQRARDTHPSGTITTMEWVTEKSRKAVPTRVLVWAPHG